MTSKLFCVVGPSWHMNVIDIWIPGLWNLVNLHQFDVEAHCFTDEPRFKKKFQVQIKFFCHCFGVPFPKMLIFKISSEIFLRIFFLVFSNRLIRHYWAPTHAFSEGFWLVSLKRSLYVKNWRNQLHFFSILGLDGSSPNSLGPSGTLWDGCRGGIKDPVGPPQGSQRVPEGPMPNKPIRKH